MTSRIEKGQAAWAAFQQCDFEQEKRDYIAELEQRKANDNELVKAGGPAARFAMMRLPSIDKWISDTKAVDLDTKRRIALIDISKTFGAHCRKCGAEIGETACYIYDYWRWYPSLSKAPVCHACAVAAAGDKAVNYEKRCSSCNRPLIGSVSPMSLFGWNGIFFCCDYCRQQYHNAQRAKRKLTSCEFCNETFQQTRSDQRFCSTKCRVYANRASH